MMRGKHNGFTLIELLVVVAIIALLISILLPALGRAREQAKAAVCMSNLRNLGQAFTMYAEEFGGVWPAAVDSMGSQNRWPVPFHRAGIISADLNRYDENGNLIAPGGPSVFLCPSERAPRSIDDWRTPGNTVDRVEVGGSYAYTGEVHRDRDDSLRLGNASEPAYVRPVDHCRRPAEIYMVMDNYDALEGVHDFGWRYYRGYPHPGSAFFQGYRTPAGDPVAPSAQVDQYKIIGGRHNGKMNALCIDTHVETTRPEAVTYNDVSWERWSGTESDPDALPPGGQ